MKGNIVMKLEMSNWLERRFQLLPYPSFLLGILVLKSGTGFFCDPFVNKKKRNSSISDSSIPLVS